MAPKVHLVCATRETDFAETPLGVTLGRISRDPRLLVRAITSNSEGLPAIYNRALNAAPPDSLVVFAHDDLWIEDYFFVDRLLDGIKSADIVGLAGTSKRHPQQVVWSRRPGSERLDLPNLRGAMAHGSSALGKIGFFGPIVGQVELLDGVFIAAKAASLQRSRVRFDERFAFHLYDLDFSRSARSAGLTLATFPLAATHRSTGGFGSKDWQAAADAYLAKWGD